MLLTKVRMGINQRGPPQCLILFEYDTNSKWPCPHCPGVPVCSWALQKWILIKLLTLEKVTYFSNLQQYYYIVIWCQLDILRYDFMNLHCKFNDMYFLKKKRNKLRCCPLPADLEHRSEERSEKESPPVPRPQNNKLACRHCQSWIREHVWCNYMLNIKHFWVDYWGSTHLSR